MRTTRPADNPLVDLVIAVHDPSRPLERAIRSVVAPHGDGGGRLRVNVVCHNISQSEIAKTLPAEVASVVRWWELNDGLRSAAGPFGFGITNADARYVSIMGSDDLLEPGAVEAWLQRAQSDRLVAVIPPQRHAAGGRIRTPPVRPRNRTLRHGVRDRLAYRTAPLGLIRRDAVDRLGLAFLAGAASGEDQIFSAKLWFSGERVGYAHGAPAYVVSDDAPDRVSMTPRPFAQDLAFADALLVDPWFLGQPEKSQRALIIKIVRTHVFGGAASRSDAGTWAGDDRDWLAAFLGRLQAICPTFARPFSLADRRLLDVLFDPDSPADRVAACARARRRFGYPATVITRDLRGLFAVEGPLRFMIASALL